MEIRVENLMFETINETEVKIVKCLDETIKSINIPQSIGYNNTTYNVVEIGDNVFEDYEFLENVIIPIGVRVLGKCCFNCCFKLDSINLPYTIEVIKARAFAQCPISYVLDLPSELKIIEFEAFTSTYITEVKCSSKLEIIECSAFEYCSRLKTINFPNSLKQIESRAFSYCGFDDEIILPNTLELLGEECFGYTEITKINIPYKTKIEKHCLKQCEYLTEIDNKSGYPLLYLL